MLGYQPPAGYKSASGRNVDKRVSLLGRFLRTILWLIAGVGLMAVVMAFWLLPLVPPVLLVLIGTTTVLALAMIAAPLGLYRRRCAAAVLGHVLSAIRLRLPLPNYLRAAATGEVPAMRRRLIRAAARLEDGSSIATALKAEASELGVLSLERLAATESNFTLERTAANLIEHEKRRSQSIEPGASSYTYFCVVAWCMAVATTVILLFVVPKMARILKDFHQPVPVTIRFLEQPQMATIILIATLLLTVLVLRTIAGVTRGLFTSRPVPSLLKPLADPLTWYAPVLGRVVRARSSAAVCEALSAAFAAGRPAPEAIATANLPALNRVLHRRMTDWHRRVDAGQPLEVAARASRMPRLLSELLAGAQLDIAGAVGFAGRAYAATSERHVLIIRAVVPMGLTAFFAAGVTILALALFQPMIAIIDSMTMKGWP